MGFIRPQIGAPGAPRGGRSAGRRGPAAIAAAVAAFDRGRFSEIKPRGAAGNGSLATDVDDRGRLLGYVL
jgi:hypothetical protein